MKYIVEIDSFGRIINFDFLVRDLIKCINFSLICFCQSVLELFWTFTDGK